MTVAEKLFVACLKSGDTKTLSLVQKEWLDIGAEISQHKFIMHYFREHGEMVGLKDFCEKFKVDEDDVDSKTTYYLNALKERYIYGTLTDKVPRIIRGVKEDPRAKLAELQSIVSMLVSEAMENKDTLYSDDIEQRIEDYMERMKSMGVTYLSMGNPDLDKYFYGYREHDLITFGGRAGQGKTWLLVYLASQLEKVLRERSEMGDAFGEILFITNEMGVDEIKERFDCLRFGLPYKDFLAGTLSRKQKNRYFNGLKSLKEEKSFIRLLHNCQTIDELSTAIGLYRPSVVFVDGSYMMENKMQEGWEKITYITRNLKYLAKNLHVPIINTTQLKRGSAKGASKMALDGQDDFAYSSSYTQDSDIAVRMYQDADMKYHDLVGMEVVKGRRVISGTKFVFQNDLLNMCHSITKQEDDKTSVDEPDEDERKDF